jgi:hypothetical protein
VVNPVPVSGTFCINIFHFKPANDEVRWFVVDTPFYGFELPVLNHFYPHLKRTIIQP